MRWHLAPQQFTFGIKHVKREENLGDILSRIDLSDLESKSLEYSLESAFDAYGSGFLSVSLTEEQEAEAKEYSFSCFIPGSSGSRCSQDFVI